MEWMALSKVDVGLKKNLVGRCLPPSLHWRKHGSNAPAQCRYLDSTTVLGFNGLRVSPQSGFVGGATLMRHGSFSLLLKNQLVAAASQEESAPSDAEVVKVRNELEKQAEETNDALKQTTDATKEQPSRVQEIFKEASSKLSGDPYIELEKVRKNLEKVRNELEKRAEESDEELKRVVNVIKEQSSKMLEISKEAYVVYAEKAKIVLKDSTEQLKLQAQNTRGVLVSTAEELSEKGKQNFSALIENAPEPVKDIAETAFGAHPEDIQKLSGVHDFCVGIPYGALLFVGGFLSFLISGSIPAIRFGVILGGIHLSMCRLSLKAWKKGDSSVPYVKIQAAIALIIFVREMRVLSQRPALFPGVFMAFV
ncbi:hypothetical protein KI387_036705, partial [Taxus chinensis]